MHARRAYLFRARTSWMFVERCQTESPATSGRTSHTTPQATRGSVEWVLMLAGTASSSRLVLVIAVLAALVVERLFLVATHRRVCFRETRTEKSDL